MRNINESRCFSVFIFIKTSRLSVHIYLFFKKYTITTTITAVDIDHGDTAGEHYI